MCPNQKSCWHLSGILVFDADVPRAAALLEEMGFGERPTNTEHEKAETEVKASPTILHILVARAHSPRKLHAFMLGRALDLYSG